MIMIIIIIPFIGTTIISRSNIDFCFHVCSTLLREKKVKWTNKQLSFVTQKPVKSTRTSVGKKRKSRKEAEQNREMIKKLATEQSKVRNESRELRPRLWKNSEGIVQKNYDMGSKVFHSRQVLFFRS